MIIKARCPHCETGFKVADEFLGRKTRGKNCGKPFAIKLPDKPQAVSIVSRPTTNAFSKDPSGKIAKVPDYIKWCLPAAIAALLIIEFSTLFNIINIAAGGFTGLQTDGKYLLIVAAIGLAITILHKQGK